MTQVITYVAIALYLIAVCGILFVAIHTINQSSLPILMLVGMGCFLEMRCLLLRWDGVTTR